MKCETSDSYDYTQMVVSPSFTNVPVHYDSELKYDTGWTTPLYHGYSPGGHAVFFPNNDEIFITGIRVYGCRFGDVQGNITVEIWDKNLTTLYQYCIPYEKLPFNKLEDNQSSEIFFNKVASWVDIGIPESRISSDFFIVIFTDSYGRFDLNRHGIFLGFIVQPGNFTSHVVHSNPNQIEIESGPRGNNQYDWMIGVLYTKQQTSAPNSSLKIPSNLIPESRSTVSANPLSTTSTSSVHTKAAMELPTSLLIIVLSIFLVRKIT